MSLLGKGIEESLIPRHINLSAPGQVSAEDYHQMITVIRGVKEEEFDKLRLEPCSITNELDKVTNERETRLSLPARDPEGGSRFHKDRTCYFMDLQLQMHHLSLV